jgi:hypothetical protein
MSGAEGKAVKGVDGMSVREESVRCMVELGVVVLSSVSPRNVGAHLVSTARRTKGDTAAVFVPDGQGKTK